MQLLAIIIPIIQISFVIHVIKTKREIWWLFIIFFIPGLGCLAYFFIEVLPDLQRSRTVQKVGTDIANVVDPTRELRRLREQLEIADTVQNRQALAQGCVDARLYDEAIDLYKSCLEGIHKDDSYMVMELARAYFLRGSFEQARELLERLAELHPNFKPPGRHLLLAKTLEQQGEIENALKEYAELVEYFSGEEARCQYALLLKKSGQTGKATEVFKELLSNAKKSPSYYRQTQKEWIEIAMQNVK